MTKGGLPWSERETDCADSGSYSHDSCPGRGNPKNELGFNRVVGPGERKKPQKRKTGEKRKGPRPLYERVCSNSDATVNGEL